MRYPDASIETSMHAVLPHRIVLHVHCVNTIAWAVRRDARARLGERLQGFRWEWIPYMASGLPLAGAIAKSVSANVFVLGNHGLVVCGDDCDEVEALLADVGRQMAICPRPLQPPDYRALENLANVCGWGLPDDAALHALGTDVIAQDTLSRGLLYPCQAFLADSKTLESFRPTVCPQSLGGYESTKHQGPQRFLIVKSCGVIVSQALTAAERETLRGLAQVVRRIPSSAPLRYLTETEVAHSAAIASHYGDR